MGVSNHDGFFEEGFFRKTFLFQEGEDFEDGPCFLTVSVGSFEFVFRIGAAYDGEIAGEAEHVYDFLHERFRFAGGYGKNAAFFLCLFEDFSDAFIGAAEEESSFIFVHVPEMGDCRGDIFFGQVVELSQPYVQRRADEGL